MKAPASVNPAELDALVALQALNTLSDSDLFALAAKHDGMARRIAACFALPLSAAGAAAGAVTKRAQRAAKRAPVAAKPSREAGALGAIAHALVAAGAAPADAVHEA
jgi:hypothetical protein